MPFVRNGVDGTSEIQNGRWQQAPSHASVPFCQTPNSRSSRSASVRPTQGLAYCAAYKLGPCIRSLPLCRRPCIRSAEPRAKVAYHVQSFPPSKPSAPPTYADTGCPWHFAKSRISNVGVNVNLNVNINIAVNLNVNTPFKQSPPLKQPSAGCPLHFAKLEISNISVQTPSQLQ